MTDKWIIPLYFLNFLIILLLCSTQILHLFENNLYIYVLINLKLFVSMESGI